MSITNAQQLVEVLNRNLDGWSQEERTLLNKALDLKVYGWGNLEELVAQYQVLAAKKKAFRMEILREQEAQAKANPSTDHRKTYCSGCESAEYQEIIAEARAEGVNPRAHLAEFVNLIVCESCEYEYEELNRKWKDEGTPGVIFTTR